MGRIEKYLGMAVEEAKASDLNSKHGNLLCGNAIVVNIDVIGAVVVKSGRVVARGHNASRTRIGERNYW